MSKFDTFIGNADVVRAVRFSVAAAKSRRVALPHILLTGYPGTGKTTLSRIVAEEVGVDFLDLNCGSFETSDSINSVLFGRKSKIRYAKNNSSIKGASLKVYPTIILFDEAHNLPSRMQIELLKPMLDKYYVCTDGTIIDITDVTFVFATTNSDMLSDPLRSRCQSQYHLDRYTPAELAKIIECVEVQDAMNRDGKLRRFTVDVRLGPQLCREVANRSRFTPRIAINLTLEYYDYIRGQYPDMDFNAMASKFNFDSLEDFFSMRGLNKHGLTKKDVQYLRLLDENGKMGLAAIASYMELGKREVSEDIEPFLRYIRFINMESNGRTLSPLGREFLREFDEINESRRMVRDAMFTAFN